MYAGHKLFMSKIYTKLALPESRKKSLLEPFFMPLVVKRFYSQWFNPSFSDFFYLTPMGRNNSTDSLLIFEIPGALDLEQANLPRPSSRAGRDYDRMDSIREVLP
jgi:hypothetical protein